MIRYFLMATVIVLTVAVLMTAWQYRDELTVHVRPTSVPTAMNGGVGGDTSGGRGAFKGQGAWALSAVPDCLRQQSHTTGPIAYVRSKIPAAAVAVSSGEQLHFGPCTIFEADGEIIVARGQDRLAVPPGATLYRADHSLVLLQTSGTSGDLRVYSEP